MEWDPLWRLDSQPSPIEEIVVIVFSKFNEHLRILFSFIGFPGNVIGNSEKAEYICIIDMIF